MTASKRRYSDVIDQLRAAGLRPTRQRLALADLLFGGDGSTRHVTAEALHAEAEAKNVRVSLATVYNTLHQFREAGLLREVMIAPGKTFFDTNVTDHHHFYSPRSGRLEDIPSQSVAISELPEPPAGRTIRDVQLVLYLDD